MRSGAAGILGGISVIIVLAWPEFSVAVVVAWLSLIFERIAYLAEQVVAIYGKLRERDAPPPFGLD